MFGEKHGAKVSVSVNRPGPPIGKPIQYEIATRNFKDGFEVARALKKEFSKIQGVESLETDADRNTLSLDWKLIMI